jgi:putative iron-dependent peroxidase
VPSATFLDAVTEEAPAVAAPASAAVDPPIPSVHDGSLGVGSLKGNTRHE